MNLSATRDPDNDYRHELDEREQFERLNGCSECVFCGASDMGDDSELDKWENGHEQGGCKW